MGGARDRPGKGGEGSCLALIRLRSRGSSRAGRAGKAVRRGRSPRSSRATPRAPVPRARPAGPGGGRCERLVRRCQCCATRQAPRAPGLRPPRRCRRPAGVPEQSRQLRLPGHARTTRPTPSRQAAPRHTGHIPRPASCRPRAGPALLLDTARPSASSANASTRRPDSSSNGSYLTCTLLALRPPPRPQARPSPGPHATATPSSPSPPTPARASRTAPRKPNPWQASPTGSARDRPPRRSTPHNRQHDGEVSREELADRLTADHGLTHIVYGNRARVSVPT